MSDSNTAGETRMPSDLCPRSPEPAHQHLSQLAFSSFILLVATSFLGVALLPFRVGAITLFPFRVLLGLQALLACAVILKSRSELQVLWPLRWYVAFLVFWLGYAAVSFLWTPAPDTALADLGQLAVGVVFVLLTPFSVRTPRHLRWLFWLWMGALAVLSGIGLWENVAGAHLPVSGYYQTAEPALAYRPTGVFRNPNDFAMFLALGLPFALAQFLFVRRRAGLLALWSLIGLVAYLVLLTGSRAAVLAAAAEFIVLLGLVARARVRDKGHAALRVVALIGAFLCANLVPAWIVSGPTTGFADSWKQIGTLAQQAETNTASFGVRWALVQDGVQAVRETHGLGIGVGGVEWWIEHRAAHLTQGILSPHNWWLELIMTYGVLIAILFCAFAGGILVHTWRLHRNGDLDASPMSGALLLALIGLFFAVLGPSSVLGLKPFWLLWGTALAAVNVSHLQRER